MTHATKISSAVASRYASALMDLAQERNVLEEVAENLNDLEAMVEASEDLSHLIRSPLISAAQQEKALFALADKARFHVLTKNFLGVLAGNRRLNALRAIIGAFAQELSRRRGEMEVQVETAQALSAEQEKALAQAIGKKLGSRVSLAMRVNPSILGGIIVTVGSQMIDDSVARKLERLKASMTGPSSRAA